MTSEIVFFRKKYCEYGWTPKYLKPTGWVRTINSTKNGVTLEKYRQIEVKTFIFFRRWVDVHTVNWTYKTTETVQIVKGFDPTNVEDVKRIFGGPKMTNDPIQDRLKRAALALEEEGMYVKADHCWAAIDIINRLEDDHKKLDKIQRDLDWIIQYLLKKDTPSNPPPYIPPKPWDGPAWPNTTTCSVCGMTLNGIMGYVCTRYNCPTKSVSYSIADNPNTSYQTYNNDKKD